MWPIATSFRSHWSNPARIRACWSPSAKAFAKANGVKPALFSANSKSIIVIEHHLAVMAHADWIIDLGPGAGRGGGCIVFEGTPADLVAARSTLTRQHLAACVGS